MSGEKQKLNFTVQLDRETIIILNKMSSFKLWKKRYPNAKIIK